MSGQDFYFPAGNSANSGLYRADPHPAGKVDHWLRPDGVTPHDRVYYEDDYSQVSMEEGQLSAYGFIWLGTEHFPATYVTDVPMPAPAPTPVVVVPPQTVIETFPEGTPLVDTGPAATSPLVYIAGGLILWKLLK